MTSYETIAIANTGVEDALGITQFLRVNEAVKIMLEQCVDCLIVIADEDDETVVGIVSDQDIVNWLSQASPATSFQMVRDIMTKDVISCDFDTPLNERRKIMKKNGIGHLPVFRNGVPVGVVSAWNLPES